MTAGPMCPMLRSMIKSAATITLRALAMVVFMYACAILTPMEGETAEVTAPFVSASECWVASVDGAVTTASGAVYADGGSFLVNGEATLLVDGAPLDTHPTYTCVEAL